MSRALEKLYDAAGELREAARRMVAECPDSDAGRTVAVPLLLAVVSLYDANLSLADAVRASESAAATPRGKKVADEG